MPSSYIFFGMPLFIASSSSLLEMGLAKYLVEDLDGHFAAVQLPPHRSKFSSFMYSAISNRDCRVLSLIILYLHSFKCNWFGFFILFLSLKLVIFSSQKLNSFKIVKIQPTWYPITSKLSHNFNIYVVETVGKCAPIFFICPTLMLIFRATFLQPR